MFSNVTQTYDLWDATIEILFMLLVAFLLGYLLALLIYRNQGNESVTYTSEVEDPLAKKYKNIDNLKIIEGVGPKIETLLNNAGIKSFWDMVHCGIPKLEKILHDAGPSYQMHNPKTWPDQAEMAMQERWSELKEYQDLLNSGKQS